MIQKEQNDIELDWLARWNLYSPDKLALKDVLSECEYSYADFYRISQGLVPFLRSWGVQKGDRVAILSENQIEMVFLFFALQRMGAVLVPVNFRLSSQEVKYILNDSGAELLFFGNAYQAMAEQISKELHGIKNISMEKLALAVKEAKSCHEDYGFFGEFEKPCKILYTSGTTGFPKGVVITPKILFWNSVNTSLSLQLSNSDSMVSFLPLFHVGGWNVLLTPLVHQGGSVFFLPKFEASQVLDVCESERVSILFGVPTTLSMMAKTAEFEKRDLSQMRFAVVGGEPMPLKMIQTWHGKGISIRQGFGLTECGPNCFSLSEKDAERKIGSIGRPNFYVQTRIVNKEGQDADVGEIGELLLKGPMCMQEYWQNQEATANAFMGGWLKTGDLVKQDSDHYFYVVGRKKEMFISGGENVYPAEVEGALSTHPEIDEVAVIGVEDEKWGEVGKAFVVCKSQGSVSEEEIADFCMDRLAKYKIPKHFEFLDELPKGSSGKILKRELISHH